MAVERIVAGIFILSILAITESLKVNCNPNCSGFADFDKVEDPYNCTNYYTCYNEMPMKYPTPCPNDTTFSVVDKDCGLPSYPACIPKCSGGGPSNCRVSCMNYAIKVNDPFSCGTYYDCNSGVLGTANHCKASFPYFDSFTDMCVNDPYVCCEFTCEPVCVIPNTFIPDYYDSSQYYWCPEIGIPTDHLQCFNKEHFNITSGECEQIPMWQSSCSALPSPVPPTGVCVESMTCTELGFFPKCNFCDSEYFFCEHINQTAVVQRCTPTLLFSLDPLTPYCVLPSECGI